MNSYLSALTLKMIDKCVGKCWNSEQDVWNNFSQVIPKMVGITFE
jgi:hypothetical protein